MGKLNALKRKSEEKKEDVAKLEGVWSLNWRSLILKACVMLMFLHFVEKFLLLFVLSFIWYWKFIFFHRLVFIYSFRLLISWLRCLLFLINLSQFKSNLLTELWILRKCLIICFKTSASTSKLQNYSNEKLARSYAIIFLFGSKAVAQKWSVKKAILEIPQNSQENTCARVSF